MNENEAKLLVWNDKFETKISSIDEQHKHLVDLLNLLSVSITNGKTMKKNDIIAIFEKLFNYTKYHFRAEEEIMLKEHLDFNFIKEHMHNHKSFTEEVQALYNNFIIDPDGASDFNISSVLDFLINWLAFHILGQDKKMARQIDYIKQGYDPAKALELANEIHNTIETAPLVNALNSIMETLLARNKELIKIKTHLKKTVEERTAQLQKANKHLENLATTDQLTGLKNRRYAMNYLNMIWRAATICEQNLSLLMLDLDHFKEINDNYGHDIGDKVLQIVASTLKSSIRPSDVLCRLGGDEFIAICQNTTLFEAVEIAYKVLKNINELKIPLDQTHFWFGSISIGVAQANYDTHTSNDLIKAADVAVYKAKDAGKNCVMFDENFPRKSQQSAK